MTTEKAKSIALNGMALERLNKFAKNLDDVTAIQCSNGNWNYDKYMHGMANGLILARAILTGEEAKFLNAPEEWLVMRHVNGYVPTVVEAHHNLLFEAANVVRDE